MASDIRNDVEEPEAEGQAYRYWCFISYSHQEKRIAGALQRFLETFMPPGALRAAITPPLGLGVALRPTFRDETELGAAGSLLD